MGATVAGCRRCGTGFSAIENGAVAVVDEDADVLCGNCWRAEEVA